MNFKKLILTALVLFLVGQGLAFMVHSILSSDYEAIQSVWRPMEDMQSKMWIMWVTGIIFAFFFVYIFAKGYEGKGIMEGVRFGIVIGLFMSATENLGAYMAFPIPFSLALKWFLFGMIEMVIYGILTSQIYKPKK